MKPRHTIMGIPVDTGDLDQILTAVEEWVCRRDTPRLIVCANAAKVVAARRSAALRQALLRADWVVPDGMGVVWASEGAISRRLAGCDLASSLLSKSDASGWRVFLLGGRPEVIARVSAVLSERYPTLALVGWHHGYLEDSQEEEVVTSIASLRPDIVLVGMGSPRQEAFLLRWLETMNAPVAMAVGGTFDVLSGRVKRAPVGVQSFGLEWAWRTLREPRRLFTVRFAHTLMFAARYGFSRLRNFFLTGAA